MATVYQTAGFYITGFNTMGPGSGTVPAGVAYIVFSLIGGVATMDSFGSGTTYTVGTNGFVITVANFPTQNL